MGWKSPSELSVNTILNYNYYLEKNFLFKSEFLHGFGRGKVDFPGHRSAFEDFGGHLGFVFYVGYRPATKQKLIQLSGGMKKTYRSSLPCHKILPVSASRRFIQFLKQIHVEKSRLERGCSRKKGYMYNLIASRNAKRVSIPLALALIRSLRDLPKRRPPSNANSTHTLKPLRMSSEREGILASAVDARTSEWLKFGAKVTSEWCQNPFIVPSTPTQQKSCRNRNKPSDGAATCQNPFKRHENNPLGAGTRLKEKNLASIWVSSFYSSWHIFFLCAVCVGVRVLGLDRTRSTNRTQLSFKFTDANYIVHIRFH